jgi:hypothetical protein
MSHFRRNRGQLRENPMQVDFDKASSRRNRRGGHPDRCPLCLDARRSSTKRPPRSARGCSLSRTSALQRALRSGPIARDGLQLCAALRHAGWKRSEAWVRRFRSRTSLLPLSGLGIGSGEQEPHLEMACPTSRGTGARCAWTSRWSSTKRPPRKHARLFVESTSASTKSTPLTPKARDGRQLCGALRRAGLKRSEAWAWRFRSRISSLPAEPGTA